MHLLSITKELIAKIEESGFYIYSIHHFRRGSSVAYEFTEVLSQTAADIQIRLTGFESRDNIGVGRMSSCSEFQEPQVSNARVRPSLKSTLTLSPTVHELQWESLMDNTLSTLVMGELHWESLMDNTFATLVMGELLTKSFT